MFRSLEVLKGLPIKSTVVPYRQYVTDDPHQVNLYLHCLSPYFTRSREVTNSLTSYKIFSRFGGCNDFT